LLFLLRARHEAGSALHVSEPPADQWIDIDEASLSAATLSPPAPPGEARSTGATEAPDSPSAGSVARATRAEARPATSAQLPSVTDAPSSDDSVVAGSGALASQGQAAPSEPERKIDLGLDGHFFLGPPSEMLPRLRKPPRVDPQKRLENALAADDVQRGLARGNALIGSLNAAAREAGPVRGEAMFRVTVGADGGVLSAELIQGVGADWSSALSSFRALAAQKRVRVPPGARGLRVTISVKAKVQRPSGKEVEASPVGVAGPSLAPNGLVPHGDFDLADLAGGGQRLVYARVVSEEVL
jgi:hypothetical protein